MLKSHAKLVTLLLFVVIGMFGFGFALVPLYKSMCIKLGINGKITQSLTDKIPSLIDLDREVRVEFVATNTGGVPWKFYPKVKTLKIHPGQIVKLAFYAENTTNYPMSVQAIPSITPGIAAKYLKKTECFCFTRQTLNGHEAMDMPLLFHLDTDLPSKVNTITLAYALFDVTDKI